MNAPGLPIRIVFSGGITMEITISDELTFRLYEEINAILMKQYRDFFNSRKHIVPAPTVTVPSLRSMQYSPDEDVLLLSCKSKGEVIDRYFKTFPTSSRTKYAVYQRFWRLKREQRQTPPTTGEIQTPCPSHFIPDIPPIPDIKPILPIVPIEPITPIPAGIPPPTMDTITATTIVPGIHVIQTKPDRQIMVKGKLTVLARVGGLIEVITVDGKRHKIDSKCLEIVNGDQNDNE